MTILTVCMQLLLILEGREVALQSIYIQPLVHMIVYLFIDVVHKLLTGLCFVWATWNLQLLCS